MQNNSMYTNLVHITKQYKQADTQSQVRLWLKIKEVFNILLLDNQVLNKIMQD